MDMYLPIIALKAITVYGMDESDLGREFAETASRFGVKTERDSEPARNLFIRSDQYSFIRRGIPALTFKFYAPAGSPENKVLSEWRHERYHAPSDDLKQPVDVEAAAEFNQIIRRIRREDSESSGSPAVETEELLPPLFRRRLTTIHMPNLNVFSLEGKTALVAGRQPRDWSGDRATDCSRGRSDDPGGTLA